MTTTKFYSEAGKTAEKLNHINNHVQRTIEFLERLCHNEEVNIEAWAVRAGKIFITFDAIAELEHLPECEMHVPATLTALFPNCRISGTLIEIESSELL